MSNRSAFYVEYVSIPLCRSAFGYRSYLKCFNVTTANYPPRKTSSRSAFNVEQVSILCRIREHSIVQVSIRIPIISLCRSAFDHTSSVSMLLPPITLLGKHQAGQHLTSMFDSRPMVAWPPTTLARHHILPRRCISRYSSSSSSIFPPKACARISSYRNGPILEISTSYQS